MYKGIFQPVAFKLGDSKLLIGGQKVFFFIKEVN